MGLERRYLLVGTLILLALGLVSCTGGPSNEQQLQNYYYGFEGVEMQFLEGTIPSLLFEGDELEIVVQLHNKGTFPEKGAPQGRIFLTGFDQGAINGRWRDLNYFPKELSGRSPINPDGTYALKAYEDRNVRIPFDYQSYDATIQATSCYKYQTRATPTICIDPEPSNIQLNKACRTRALDLRGGQGAPIAVTRVEPRISADKIIITAHIINAGRGSVVKPSGLNTCPYSLDYRDIDRVQATMKSNFGGFGDCSPEGSSADPIRLINGKGSFTCVFNNPGGFAFTTPIEIVLDYVYSDSIQRQITIQNPVFRR